MLRIWSMHKATASHHIYVRYLVKTAARKISQWMISWTKYTIIPNRHNSTQVAEITQPLGCFTSDENLEENSVTGWSDLERTQLLIDITPSKGVESIWMLRRLAAQIMAECRQTWEPTWMLAYGYMCTLKFSMGGVIAIGYDRHNLG